jgi:hypothetical protein
LAKCITDLDNYPIGKTILKKVFNSVLKIAIKEIIIWTQCNLG